MNNLYNWEKTAGRSLALSPRHLGLRCSLWVFNKEPPIVQGLASILRADNGSLLQRKTLLSAVLFLHLQDIFEHQPKSLQTNISIICPQFFKIWNWMSMALNEELGYWAELDVGDIAELDAAFESKSSSALEVQSIKANISRTAFHSFKVPLPGRPKLTSFAFINSTGPEIKTPETMMSPEKECLNPWRSWAPFRG